MFSSYPLRAQRFDLTCLDSCDDELYFESVLAEAVHIVGGNSIVGLAESGGRFEEVRCARAPSSSVGPAASWTPTLRSTA